MKLTARQLNQIKNLIEDEEKMRRNLHNEMYDRRRNYVLAEGPVDSMYSDDLSVALQSELDSDNAAQDLANDMRVDFDKKMFSILARLIVQSGGEKVSGPVLMDDLEDYDADELMTAQQTLATDVSMALEKYAASIALLASSAKLMGVGEGPEA